MSLRGENWFWTRKIGYGISAFFFLQKVEPETMCKISTKMRSNFGLISEFNDRNGCIEYYVSSITNGIKRNRMVLGQECFISNIPLERSL